MKPQKNYFSSGLATKRAGGGGRAGPLRLFYTLFLTEKKRRKKVPMTTKPEGRGGGGGLIKAFMVGPLVEELFLMPTLALRRKKIG